VNACLRKARERLALLWIAVRDIAFDRWWIVSRAVASFLVPHLVDLDREIYGLQAETWDLRRQLQATRDDVVLAHLILAAAGLQPPCAQEKAAFLSPDTAAVVGVMLAAHGIGFADEVKLPERHLRLAHSSGS
jgi:hypothetical protein